jgi:type II secretory pathway component GspD/PulD (secretin)
MEIAQLVAEYRAKAGENEESARAQLAREYETKILELLSPDQRRAYESGTAVPRLRFQFRFQRWEHVLQWLAEQAGLSLVLDAPPPGTFNYTDTREYTPSEAIDLVNSVLLTKGYALVRREQMLILVSLQRGIPEGVIPWVSPEEASRRGAYDLVTVSFSVGRRDASQVAEAIKPLLGPYGRVMAIPATRQVVVTDRAGLMASIEKVIQALPEPSPPRQEPPPREPERQELRVYPLGTVDVTAVQNVLRELYPAAKIVHDTRLNQLHILATPSQHSGIETILRRLQSPESPERVPRLEVYPLPSGTNVTDLVNSLQLVAPNAKMRGDQEGNRLVVWGSEAEQEQIRTTLEKLKDSPEGLAVPQLESYQLSRSDARMVAYVLEKLVPKAKVTYDYSGRRLMVYATPSELAIVRSVIQELEPQAVSAGQAEIRVYTLRRVLPSSLAEMLREALPAARITADDSNRRLTVVAPPDVQAHVEAALREADAPPAAEEETRLRIYSLPQAATDSTFLQTVTTALQQVLPQVKVTADPRRGQLLVYGTEQEHQRVAEVLSQLAEGARPIEGELQVYPVSAEERSRLQSLLSSLSSELPTIRVMPDSTPGTIAIWARPQEHQMVQQLLEQLRQAGTIAPAQILRSYPLKVIDPAAAQQTLRTLFPHLQVVVEPAARRLVIWATEEEHAAVGRVLDQLDVPLPQEAQPRFETYAIRGASASTVLSALQQMVPGARLVLDPGGRKIIAWGTPAEHKIIADALAQLGQGESSKTGPYLVVYPLKGLSGSSVLPILQSLVPEAQLTLDAEAGNLLAVASSVDHETIRAVIDRLVESRRTLGGAELRYYPYQATPSSGLLELLKKLAPTAEVTVDKENRRLMVLATAEDHSIIEQTLRQYESGLSATEQARTLVVYQLTPAQRKRFDALRPALESQLPGMQVLPETAPGELAVWARPEEHQLLDQIIRQLQQPAQAERPYQLIVHPITSADPNSVASMLEKLFPDAQVVVDTKARRVMIWAPSSAEAQIRQALRELDSGTPGQWQEQLKVYPVTKADVQVAMQVLKERVPEARITPDLKANTLLVWAVAADHEQVAKILEQLEAGVEERYRHRLEVYPPGKLDLTALSSLLRVLVPEARLAVDPKTGGLAVLARPEDHELIRQTLERLAAEDFGGQPEARTYTVSGGGSPYGVLNILSTVFPTIRVTLGTAPNQLLVWARPEEHQQVAKVLEELQKPEPPETAPRLETYTVEGTTASEASRVLRLIVPEATLSVGTDPQQLLVWARPDDHAKIRQALEQWLASIKKPEALPEMTVFSLRYISVYSAMQALRTLVPEAQFAVGGNEKQLLVLARPGQLERIAAAIEKMDVPPTSAGELRVYTLEGMSSFRAFYAARFLREAVPEATITLGADPTQLLVWASPEQHERVRSLVDTLLEPAPAEKAPRAEVYRLKSITAASASQVLRAAVPEATLTPDSADPYRLTVWASPQEHEVIARVLGQIDVPESEGEKMLARVYTVEGMLSYYAIQILSRMFPAAQFVPTADPQQLVAWARAEEHPKIQEAISLLTSAEDAPSLVTYELQSLDARTATSLIQSVVPAAKVTASTDGRKLHVHARQADHLRIADALRQADVPSEENTLRMEVYPVRGVGNAYTVMMLLREVFPQAKFSIGANLQQLVVYASPAEHAQIAQAIERLGELTKSEQPEMEVYDVGAADVSRLAPALEVAFPGARFVPAPEPGKLIAWAPRSDQQLIAQAIEKLKNESWGPENRVMAVYPLRRGDAQTLLQLLTPMARDRAQFVIDNTRNALVVWADRRYHEAIRQAIDQYLASLDEVAELEPRVYRFRYADPTAAATVVRSLAPDAQVAFDWANQVLVVSASADDHRKIEAALTQLDRPDVGGLRPLLQVYPLRDLDAAQAYSNLRQLFRADPSVQLALDENANAIVAIAPESKQEQIARVMEEMQFAAREGGGVLLQSYSLRNIDPQAALSLVRNLAQQRGIRADVTLDARGNQLLVVTRAEHHRWIAEALEQIRGQERELEILQLEEVDPYTAQTAIRQLFAGESNPPEVEIDYSSQQLIIQATQEQHRRIRDLLGKLGETRLAVVSALGGGTPRVVPFEGNVLEALREIERVWPRLRKNPIRVIVPQEGGKPGEPGVLRIEPRDSSRTSGVGGGGSTPASDAQGGRQQPPSASVIPPSSKEDKETVPDSGESGKSPSAPQAQDLPRSWQVQLVSLNVVRGCDTRPPSDELVGTGADNSEPASPLGRGILQLAVFSEESKDRQGEAGTGGEEPEEGTSAEKPQEPSRQEMPDTGQTGDKSGSLPESSATHTGEQSGSVGETEAEPPPAGPSGSEVPPVYVIVQDGSVTIVSDDPEAAAELESLLRTLSARTGPSGRTITVYELRHANASSVAETIQDFLRSTSWGWRRSLSGLVIIPDDRQNTLLVQASRADRAVIEELLRILDAPQLPEAMRANQPRIIPLKNMDATRAQEVVQNVFRAVFTPPQPRYSPWGTVRQVGPGPLTPQLAVDTTTNSLILSGPTAVLDQIEDFVKRLDQTAADDPARQLMIIPLQKMNATRVERAIQELVPRSYYRRSW